MFFATPSIIPQAQYNTMIGFSHVIFLSFSASLFLKVCDPVLFARVNNATPCGTRTTEQPSVRPRKWQMRLVAAAKKAKADGKSQRDEDRVRLQNFRSEGFTEYIWEDGIVEFMPLKRAAQLHGSKGKHVGSWLGARRR